MFMCFEYIYLLDYLKVMYVFIYVYIFMLTSLLTYYLYLFYTNFIFFMQEIPTIFSCCLVGFTFPGLKSLTKW